MLKLIRLCFCLLGVFPGVVIAAEPDNIRLNTTVISSSGFNAPVKDENKNVVVVNNEDIKQNGYNNITQALDDAPFVNLSLSAANPNPIVDLRGYGNNAASNTLILIDEIPINILDNTHSAAPINTLPLSSLDQIEIIPGGASVLYGNGATGGVIDITTKSHNLKEYLDTSLLYKSYKSNYFTLGGGQNFGDLYLSLDYANNNEHGYRYDDKVNSNAVDSTIAYKLQDNMVLSLNAKLYKDNATSTSGITQAQMDDNRRSSGDITDYDTKTQDYSLNYDWKVNDNNNLKLNALYQRTDIDNTTYGFEPNANMSYTEDGDFKEERKGVNIKNKYNYNNTTTILGYSYLDNSLVRNSITNMLPGGPVIPFMNDKNDLDKQTHSFFIQEKIATRSDYNLLGGVRFELAKYDISRDDLLNDYSIDTNKNDNNTAFNVGISKNIGSTGNTYLTFERGYVSPSPAQLTNKVLGVGYEMNDLKSQIVNTTELGYKDMLTSNILANLTAFYSISKDEIVQEFPAGDPHAAWTFYNINETRRIGLEALSEQYVSDFTFAESVSYIDADITKGEFDGEKVALVPALKATASIAYNILNGLNVKAKAKYFGKSKERDGSDTYIDPYTVVDLSTSYTLKNNLSFMLGVNNLFAEEYNLYQLNGIYVPAPERTFYFGVNYAF